VLRTAGTFGKVALMLTGSLALGVALGVVGILCGRITQISSEIWVPGFHQASQEPVDCLDVATTTGSVDALLEVEPCRRPDGGFSKFHRPARRCPYPRCGGHLAAPTAGPGVSMARCRSCRTLAFPTFCRRPFSSIFAVASIIYSLYYI
jgi:hypothetical protein